MLENQITPSANEEDGEIVTPLENNQTEYKDSKKDSIQAAVSFFKAGEMRSTKKQEESGQGEDLEMKEAFPDEDRQKEQKPKEKNKYAARRKIKKVAVGVLSACLWVFSFGLLLFYASNVYQQMFNQERHTGFFGIGSAVVSSGSMEPMLYKDDLVFYRGATASDVGPGDVVIYKKQSDEQELLVIHQVVSIDNGYAITQGINNAQPDTPFPSSMIVGKYLFKINGVGSLLRLLSTGWAPLIVGGFFLLSFAVQAIYYTISKNMLLKHISSEKEARKALNKFYRLGRPLL